MRKRLPVCHVCELLLRERDPSVPTLKGTIHRICFDICSAALTAELEAMPLPAGWTERVDEQGRRLMIPPPPRPGAEGSEVAV